MNDPFNPNPFGPSYPIPASPDVGAYMPARDTFRAVLTAKTDVGGIWNYDWTEQTFDPADGSSTDANPARSGSYSGGQPNSPALELNNTEIDLTDPVYVWMRQKGFVLGQPYYEFAYTPPGGSSTPSSWKTPAVRAATTTTLPANTYSNGSSGVGAILTGNSNGALSAQDGVTLSVNQDLLVKDEASGLKKGIYTLTQVGDGSHPYILTRRTDCDTAADVLGAVVAVEEGTTNADTVWLCTANATITMGTTALPWLRISMSGTGTDNHITRWDGAQAVQDSFSQISDAGVLSVYATTSPASTDPVIQFTPSIVTGTHTSRVLLNPFNLATPVTLDAISTSSGTLDVVTFKSGIFRLDITTSNSGGQDYPLWDYTNASGSINLFPATCSYGVMVQSYAATPTGAFPNLPFGAGMFTAWEDFSGSHSGGIAAWLPQSSSGSGTFLISAQDQTKTAQYALISGSSTFTGLTGTLAPGAVATGGIITTLGTKLSAITPLAGGASLADTVTKVNEIITALQTAGITL